MCRVRAECRREASVLALEVNPRFMFGVWDGKDWTRRQGEPVKEWKARVGMEER